MIRFPVSFLSQKAHPRIRGEYLHAGKIKAYVQGSPPHTRGIFFVCSCISLSLRLTPAYAGNIQKDDGCAQRDGAHPRIRGEYDPLRDRTNNDVGSPPHTRGISTATSMRCTSMRLTPAYAGNIVTELTVERLTEAHPRIRGEYCSSYG